MGVKSLPSDLQEAVDAYHKCRSKSAAARFLGLSKTTYYDRLAVAVKAGYKSNLTPAGESEGMINEISELRCKIRTLESTLSTIERDKLTTEFVRTQIFKIERAPVSVPEWLVKTSNIATTSGVPTLFASDWHWGEVVDPKQVGGVNQFNIKIGQERAKRLIEKSIDLLHNHFARPDYPGIVFVLGGDMLSGDIHDELSQTNEIPTMPALLDLFGVITWCINQLADSFGKVFVPCVTGNHGRNTFKIYNKNRTATSFDWLLYMFLSKRFEGDDRVQFLIPDGPDAMYSIYNHRYLLSHGDSFKGGDGIIGAIGSVIRGDYKKRSRAAQVGQPYDTLLCGHFHQLIQLDRLIINGSLKGYCEYANSNNFSYEPPRQALWITHPEHGITFSAPIHVDSVKTKPTAEWISWMTNA
jgi:hypothetical protein